MDAGAIDELGELNDIGSSAALLAERRALQV
jgi:hypothetical protein